MQRSGLAEMYNTSLCTLLLDLTSESGFATGFYLKATAPKLRFRSMKYHTHTHTLLKKKS